MTEEVQNEKISPWPAARRHGLILALLLIGYFLISNIAGFYGSREGWAIALNAAVNTGLLFFIMHKASSLHRDHSLNGVINFGQSFTLSLFVVLIGTAIYIVFSYIFMKFIDRSILEEARLQALTELERQDIDDEAYEAAEKMIGIFTGPAIISISTFFVQFIWGLAVGLVVGLVIKKDKPVLEN